MNNKVLFSVLPLSEINIYRIMSEAKSVTGCSGWANLGEDKLKASCHRRFIVCWPQWDCMYSVVWDWLPATSHQIFWEYLPRIFLIFRLRITQGLTCLSHMVQYKLSAIRESLKNKAWAKVKLHLKAQWNFFLPFLYSSMPLHLSI